jgi:anti-anti-sigma regulatory factor
LPVREFQLTADSIAGVLLITLAGELDESACGQLEECLQQAVRARRAVVVDLTEADNLPDAAIGALTAARPRLGVRMRVVAPRGRPPHAALRKAGVHHTLNIHASGPSALAAARG